MSILEFRAENLPSRGITYPDGTVFTVQMFSYGEVQDLNTTDLTVETKIGNFIKAISTNTNLQGENIAYIDYMYMHLGRVASVYGNDTLRLPIICPFCGGSTTEKVKFTDLEMNDISEYGDIIPFKFDVMGKEFTFNFLTLEKIIKWFRVIENIQRYDLFIEVQKEYDSMKKEVSAITPENPNTVLLNKWEKLSKQFLELNGQMTKKNKEQALKYKPYGYNALLLAFMCSSLGTPDFDDFLERLNNSDLPRETLEFLDFVETTLGTGLKSIKTTCPHCQKVFVYSLEDNVNDVYPFRNSSSDIANKLRALQASKTSSISVEEGGFQRAEDTVRKSNKRQGFASKQQGYIGGSDTLSTGDEQEEAKPIEESQSGNIIDQLAIRHAEVLKTQENANAQILQDVIDSSKKTNKASSIKTAPAIKPEETERKSNLNNTGE